MKSALLNSMVSNAPKTKSIVTLSVVWICLCVNGGVSPVVAQELISPGRVSDAGDMSGETQELPPPSPSRLGQATENPFAQKDTLIPAPSDGLTDDSSEDLLIGDPLEDYRKTLEEHLLNKERAKLEARARFESRSRDLIPPPLSPKRLSPPNRVQTVNENEVDLELDQLRSKLDEIESLPTLSDSEDQASPSDRPKQQKRPSTTDRDLDDLLAPPVPRSMQQKQESPSRTLPAPLRERNVKATPRPLGQSTETDGNRRDDIPKYQAAPPRPKTVTPFAEKKQPTKQAPSEKAAEETDDETKDSSLFAADEDESKDEETDSQPSSVLSEAPAQDEIDWSTIVDSERHAGPHRLASGTIIPSLPSIVRAAVDVLTVMAWVAVIVLALP